MSLPETFRNLKVPAIAAPMFLVSGPQLVIECCRAGVVGTFPALNQRTTEGFDGWLSEIEEALGEDAAPYGVNLIVHRTNPRVQADLAVCVRHRVPLVITSLGAVSELVAAVHSYGGVVFHDVTNLRHAQKAAEAGVDGLIAVCAGAGGHAGTMSPFALTSEIRQFFDGTLILAGAISHGRQIAAARLMGADLAYLGTRFIATRESLAPDEYKQMVVGAVAKDIVYTSAISGVHANFLEPSLSANHLDPAKLKEYEAKPDLKPIADEVKAWKTVWSAGQGVGSIDDVPSAAELCQRLHDEYRQALAAAAEL
jgi:nitronate monooxygenase